MADQVFSAPCLEVHLGEIPAYTFTMTVGNLVYMYYVAVRGVDHVEGAVQRPLNTRRIESIRDYVLDGNTFFNSFILNWTAGEDLVTFEDGMISFPLQPRAAQVLDGQHRIAGLEKAIESNPNIADQSLIVTLSIGLTNKEAAQIFLNINTEQRPVPRSLIFDLFGLKEDDPKHAINRATDIARALNDDSASPLFELVKFPGAARGAGRIELSSFVAAFKPHLEKDGVFYKARLSSLEHQKLVVNNFFAAIKEAYVRHSIWASTAKNPFLKAAGFNGAVDFLGSRLINECASRGSFSQETMSEIMNIKDRTLLLWDELKGQDGKTARKNVSVFLETGLLSKIDEHGSYKF
jgi:DGQHR domain-containing protein